MSHQLFTYGTGVNGNWTYDGSFGSQLTTTSAIQITALGAFLDSSTAWTVNKIVQIWNSAGTTVLATITIAPADIGVTATLTNGYVLKTLGTPITIAASTTFLLAVYGYGVDKFQNQGRTTPVAPTVDLSSGTLTLSTSAYFSSTTGSASAPTGTTSGQDFGGPTFVYGPVPTGSVGSASGTSAATGVSPALASSVGTATGTSTVTGVGAGNVGTSAGTSTVTGVSPALASSVGTATGTSTASGVAGGSILAPNNAAITYSPFNWNVQSTFAQTVNPGAYFDILFTGTSITLAFDATTATSTGSLCWYRVDGGAWVSWSYASSLAITSLTSNKHLFEFVYAATTIGNNRWNTGQKTGIYLTSITLDTTATASATVKAPWNVLIFGDSITEGYATRGTGGQPTQNDALPCWSYTMRELLGANVGVVGFGSQGWTQIGQGNVPVLPSAYNLLYAGVSRVFTAPYPNLIIIAHGANDGGGTGTIAGVMATVLAALKAACPAAKILMISPLNGTVQSYIQAGAVAAGVSYANAQNAGLVTADYNTDVLHPLAASSRAVYAPWVAAQIKAQSLLSTASRSRSVNLT